jgi:hypothetical protein
MLPQLPVVWCLLWGVLCHLGCLWSATVQLLPLARPPMQPPTVAAVMWYLATWQQQQVLLLLPASPPQGGG